ncbi:MAG: hypothetical protein KME45_03185 [Stenomitos rutilans HA7619-LM2]|jgi:hypothetical protein|nr:hypothetical protein [Stenomitos rutilans HA7619-LM2]MBW4469389.1 hypothetical protein [Stenomitos rutilans HA7619-LM2]
MKHKVQCLLYRNGNRCKTLVVVEPPFTSGGISKAIWQAKRLLEEKLDQEGWDLAITTGVSVGNEVAEELEPGASLVDGDVTATEYVTVNTSYEWVFERLKKLHESVGRGQLPGDVGFFRKKLTESDRS